jgi:cell division septation protein DedD
LLARQEPAAEVKPPQPSASRVSTGVAPAITPPAAPAVVPKPAAPKPSSSPTKKAPAKSRYAVQVVTYAKTQFAQAELKRLQQKGEAAFLVMRQGHTVLYVGPFPSHEDARAKVTTLKTRYRDCFVKTL